MTPSAGKGRDLLSINEKSDKYDECREQVRKFVVLVLYIWSSAAIDHDISNVVAEGLDGDTRPDWCSPDIGANEFAQA